MPEHVLDRIVRDPAALVLRQIEADRLIAASGAAHLVQELAGRARNRPWRLDPVPYVLPGEVFDRLADGVAERQRAMEGLLADLYGPRRVVRDGIVPAEALASSPRYRLASVGAPPPHRWLTVYAVDVVALTDGSWRIVQDLTDTPTGIGYALLDRAVMARVALELLGGDDLADLASISGFPAELRHALTSLTTAPSPRVVLFSGGLRDAAYVEHSSLARQLGFNLVERADLVVRKGRLWLRTLGGLDPIDVVYRRVADGDVDPIEIQATGRIGVPGLSVAAAEGGVALGNAHGAGVIEDPDLVGYWPAAIAGLDGHAPMLRALSPADEVAAVPVLRDGRLESAQVVVRIHAVAGPDGVTVMAGGNGRVLAPGDDPRAPSAHMAKDVWVFGAGRTAPVIVAPHLPQVDLATSVPTRAADALFWMGRSAERAEAIARTVRVIAARRQQDPALVSYDGGRWARRMVRALRAVRADGQAGGDGDQPGVRPPVADLAARPVALLHGELTAAAADLGIQLDALVTEAASVGEFLSGTSSRVLNRLAKLRRSFSVGRVPIDALDDVLEQLAAFAGLWAESTVRGPAWRFGELGRRLERADVVLGLVEACTDAPAAGHHAAPERGDPGPVDIVDRSALEVLLAANESLVAYRRHHRSDVELGPTLDLLVDDPDNPRSYAACIGRLGEHVAAIGWEDGMRAAAALGNEAGPTREAVSAFATLVAGTWFATPVDPVLVHGEVNT